MITWPDSLIGEIASRRCIFVLGAGTSAGAHSADGKKRPPDWISLLSILLGKVPHADDRKQAQEMINKEKFLDAAQIIRDHINESDFNNTIINEFQTPNYKETRVHGLILDLDPKIIITTNYDQIFELYSTRFGSHSGYNPWRYHDSDGVMNDIRSPRRVILKVHGCVTNPAKVVLTRADYFNARRSASEYFGLLDALFLTQTLLFVGSSLSDPDIQLLLENANISARSVHPHYAVVPKGRHDSIKKAIKATYNVELLEYDTGHHEEVEEALTALLPLVQDYRITYP